MRGLRRVHREAEIEAFEHSLADCEVLPFDDAAGRLAGKIYADLETRGRPIGMPDVMIAAIAVQHGAVLASGNVSHFEVVRPAGCAIGIDNWRNP